MFDTAHLLELDWTLLYGFLKPNFPVNFFMMVESSQQLTKSTCSDSWGERSGERYGCPNLRYWSQCKSQCTTLHGWTQEWGYRGQDPHLRTPNSIRSSYQWQSCIWFWKPRLDWLSMTAGLCFCFCFCVFLLFGLSFFLSLSYRSFFLSCSLSLLLSFSEFVFLSVCS